MLQNLPIWFIIFMSLTRVCRPEILPVSTSTKSSDLENLSTLYGLRDFEAEAERVLAARNQSDAWIYLQSGAVEDETVDNNARAFHDWRIRSHVLRDVSNINTASSVLGSQLAMPIGVSPSAPQSLWHPDGELATARAVEVVGGVMILSVGSSWTLEAVADAAPNATRWFQMFPPPVNDENDPHIDLIHRAEAAGYSALVLTVDMPVSPYRYSTSRSGFSARGKYPRVNYAKYGNWSANPHANWLTWKDISWIRNLTRLPIVLKGILTAEDAREAVRAGISGIIVSNHGGRQLDGAPATVEALPEVVAAVRAMRSEIPVCLDGGVRSGKDVFRAIALGANAVFVGRPAPWGLIVGGDAGVHKVLSTLGQELESVMGQAGCAKLADIHRDNVSHKLKYAIAQSINYKYLTQF